MKKLLMLLMALAWAALSLPSWAAEVSAADDLKRIKESGVLRVAVKDAMLGFSYQDPVSGKFKGFDIELARIIARELGVNPEFQVVIAKNREEVLIEGKADVVIASYTITDRREQLVSFSYPYHTDYATLIVDRMSGIKVLRDLKDKTIGVVRGSDSPMALLRELAERGVLPVESLPAADFDPARWDSFVRFRVMEDFPDLSTALSHGTIDAICSDKSVLAIYRTKKRTFIDDEFAPQPYAVGMRKGSPLKPIIDRLIKRIGEDGTLDRLYRECLNR
ncbi:MAG: transporter substrate-binding domain-containing protein [Succinivibrionaceae bacterium]|nr:transporter substrate-binding domain-containing protein [Succinivibrionaceae bacterium]